MFVLGYIFVYVYAFVYVYVYVSVIVYVFVHVSFSPTAKPWGSNLLIRRFALSFGWKSPPAKKMIPMGVNKALDGKGRFLKPDYHYTTIFLAS